MVESGVEGMSIVLARHRHPTTGILMNAMTEPEVDQSPPDQYLWIDLSSKNVSDPF